MDSTISDTQPALATVAGDQCASCGAPLAPDQRYCVQCGQRRGQARLPVAQATAVEHQAPAARHRAARMTGNTTLIAGIGTLLLAMGVGVLIGRSGQRTTSGRASAPVQVVTVAGGAAGRASTPATTAAAKKHGKAAGRSAKAPTPAQAAKAIKGTTVKLPPKAVVKVGQPGHGPGYKNGKFTGDFFGGG
jgi:hypothetical protein